MTLPAFTDWRLVAGSHLDRRLVPWLIAAAVVALVLSALSLFGDRRKGRAALLLVLRAGAILACLIVAVEPSLELRQVARVPNHVAVLVDTSRSMTVKPPDGGQPRYARAAKLVDRAAPTFARWAAEGHKVEVFGFGESLSASSVQAIGLPPKGEATRLGEAFSELRGRYAGRDLGAVIVLSDGIDTGRIGAGPLDGETRAAVKALAAPVHTVLIDEPMLKDLSIATVLADDFAFVRTPIKLEAIVRQSGLSNREVEVSLSRDGRLVDATTVRLKGDRSEVKVSFPFTPDRPGNFVFTIETPVLAGEALASNNRQVFTIKVIRDRVRVLHVCGRPSWDERFLRSLLRLNPNVDLVSFFILRTEFDEQPYNRQDLSLIPFPDREIFQEQLKSFDLLIFHNFNYEPYNVKPYLPGVRDYVESGGALAMIGGDLSFASGGYADSALRDVLPVELDGIPLAGERSMTSDRFKPRLTAEGLGHPVTSLSLEPKTNEARWGALPPLEGINRVARLRPGASALLVHPGHKTADGKPAPVVAVGESGKGRTLALMTDSAWHWGLPAAGAGEDGRAFQRFWEGAINWLVHDPALTLLRLELDRVEYQRGQPIGARIRALHGDYTAAAGVSVNLVLSPADKPEADKAGVIKETAPGDKPVPALEVTTNSEGEAHLSIPPPASGAWRLAARASVDGRTLSESKTFVVRPEGRELEDVVGRDAVLRELATVTGGEFARGSLGDLPLRPLREERVGTQRTVELWSHPALLMIALLLLTAEWALRRRAGHA